MLDLPDPLIARYLGSEKLLEPARDILSDQALYLTYCVRVELAWLRVLARRGRFAENLVDAAEESCQRIQIDEIAQEEARVNHDLKAVVNVMTRYVPEPLRPFVHLGATSYDILSNAHLLRLRDGCERVALPALRDVAAELIRLAREEAGTHQVGRTHGQHAEPVTFGYAMAVYLERLGFCIQEIQQALTRLRGKFSGAVGAYNTIGLLFEDPREVEREVLGLVGLEPARNATQITHPEPALAVLHHLTAAFGVLANLADDLRHLQRTEIAEVAEAYKEGAQVGSSAMPHKRNPITWENVKSLWKVFMPQIMTFYMDQISEHQRDLSNSASARFLPRVVLGVAVAARRSARGLKGLYVDRDQMKRNLELTGQIISGPAQTLFSWLGIPDAHETVRRLSLQAQKEKTPLLQHLSPELLEPLSPEHRHALEDPLRLTRHAEKSAREVADLWERILQN